MFAYDTIALRNDLIEQAGELHLEIPAEARPEMRARPRPRDVAARQYYVRNPFAPARRP